MAEKQSWRKQAAGTTRRPMASKEDTSAWKNRRTRDSKDALLTHRLRLFGLACIGGALVALLVYAWLTSYAETPVVAVAITQYESAAVPPNDFAWEDFARLQDVTENNDDLSSALAESQAVTRAELKAHLEQSLDPDRQEPGGPGRDAFVIYLSTHGLLNEKAEPCLLTSDSNPLDANTWLPVREVLTLIDAQLGRHPSAKAVLLLDCSHLDGSWSMGQLYQGFDDGLQRIYDDLFADRQQPRIFVINSSSSGQVARMAPELGGTVFGFYVANGLDGAASEDGRRVTLLGLYHYLENQVAGWVSYYRDSSQRPSLIPAVESGQDFAIAFASGRNWQNRLDSAPAALPQWSAEATANWNRLRALWKRMDELDRVRAARENPLGLARLQRKLLRAERLSFAGPHYGQQLATTIAELDGLFLAVENRRLAKPQLYSLPLAESLTPLPAGELQDAQTQFDLWITPPDAEGKKPELPPQPPSYRASARVAWTWLAERVEVVARPQLEQVLDFVQRSRRDESPDVVEVHFLRILASYLDWNSTALTAQSRAVRDAIRCRNQGELLSSPADVRTHYWLHQPMAAGDSTRRLAEDQLLTGAPDAVPLAAQQLAQLSVVASGDGQYATVSTIGQNVAAAFRQRDLAWSNVPYLAQWLLRRSSRQAAAGPSTPAAAVATEILSDPYAYVEQLLADMQELDSQLQRSPDEPVDTGPQSAYQQVRRRFNLLNDFYTDECESMVAGGNNEKVLRDILDGLSTPLIPADRRMALGDKAISILFKKTNPATFPEEHIAQALAAASSPDTTLPRLAGTRLHPALQILQRDQLKLLSQDLLAGSGFHEQRDADPLLWLARQGDEVRWRQRTLIEASDRLEKVTDDRLGSFTLSETAFNARAGLAEAERLTRAASVLFAPYRWKQGGDPVARLSAVDWHYLLSWQCRRTLDDFWGPRPPDTAADSSYFNLVARQYMKAALAMDDKATRTYFDGVSLDGLREQRLQAAKATQVRPADVITLDSSAVSTSEPQTIAVDFGPNLPPGRAAVYVHSKPGAAGPDSLVPVQSPVGDTIRRHDVPVDAGKSVELQQRVSRGVITDYQSGQLFASALFRGHVRTKAFRFEVPQSRTVIAQLQGPESASITVGGDQTGTGHIMFVLDSSGSMDIAGRMDRAKSALLHILQLLRQEGGYNVGLRAYGHRYRYRNIGNNRTDGTVESSANKGVYVRRARDNHPDHDVQLLVPMQDMRRAAEHIAVQLQSVGSWGQTPLYQAISEALEGQDFQQVPQGEPKHLVVLTDGRNDLYNPQWDEPNVVGKATWRRQDVLDRLRAAPDIKLHLIGIQLNPQDPGIRELQSLAAEPGLDVTYDNASNLDQLVAFIRESLRLVRFSVSPSSDQQDLGQTWNIARVNPDGERHAVQVHGDRNVTVNSVDVTLYGGEALKLAYDRDGFRLKFQRYLPQSKLDVQQRPSPSGDQNYDFILDANHEDQDLHFEISMQNTDLFRFTDRPKYVWAEIQPRNGQLYQFSDLEFVEDRPVPVMRFTAKNWPRVELADIRLWIRTDPVPNPVIIKMDPQGGVTGIPAGSGRPLFATQKKSEANYMIVEVEEDRAVSGDRSPAHIQLHSPRPRLAEHQFHRFADQRELVLHRFYYEPGAALPTVNVIPRQQIQNGAIYVEFRDVRTPLK